MATEQLVSANPLDEAVDAIRGFPVERRVPHCGGTFAVSPFAIYGTCPVCGERFKLRSFAAVTEVEDVFDAVFEWMSRSPQASAYAAERVAEITADQD
jgi:hypothetical protein